MASNLAGSIGIFKSYRVRAQRVWFYGWREAWLNQLDRSLDGVEEYTKQMGEVLCPTDGVPLSQKRRTMVWAILAWVSIFLAWGYLMTGRLPNIPKLLGLD